MNNLKKISKYIIAFLLLITVTSMNAQELLTPEDAVAFAVSKNFDIVIAKNEADIARINNNKGEAGMLPVIDVRTGDVFNLNNINQKFTTGESVKKNWVPVNAFSASANLNWTIFDGFRMFAAKDRLEALQAQGELELKAQIQNTVAEVLSDYYGVVRQKQQLRALNESFKISDERVKLSQRKFEVGYSDKTPFLQARVDYAQQQVNILNEEQLLKQVKADLNQVIGRNPDIEFDVIDTIDVNYIPDLQKIRDTALLSNFAVQSAMKDIDIAKFERKELNAQRLPSINFATGYAFSQNNSKAGLQLFNRSYGPLVGVNAVIPIYNGGRVKKELEASSVNIAIQQIEVDQLKNDIDTRIIKAYQNYIYAKKALAVTEENVKTANENASISMERFRLGESNSLEIRQAQSSYEDALYNVIVARYNAKIAEIELKKLSNDLVK